jgi:hypothetical protein
LAEVLLSSQFIFSRSLVFDKSRVVNGTVARGGAFPPSLPEKLASSAGSPPHLRGTHIAVMYVGLFVRITPAPAGNTLLSILWLCPAWDHPRTCGEHFSTPSTPSALAGSPPHLRGTLSKCFSLLSVSRITPAPAGNTPTNH